MSSEKMSAPALNAKMKGNSERLIIRYGRKKPSMTRLWSWATSFELLQNCSLRINACKGPLPEWDLCNCIFWPFANVRPQPVQNRVGLKIGAAYHSPAETDSVNCRTCVSSARPVFTSWTFQSARWQMCSRTSLLLSPAVASSTVWQHRGRSETKINGSAKAIFTQHLNTLYTGDWRACW